MSSAILQPVASLVATGSQFTASGYYAIVASGVDQFAALLDLLPQPARQALNGPRSNPALKMDYPVLRVHGRTDTEIEADIQALTNGSRPTRVIAMRLSDGSYLFAGVVK